MWTWIYFTFRGHWFMINFPNFIFLYTWPRIVFEEKGKNKPQRLVVNANAKRVDFWFHNFIFLVFTFRWIEKKSLNKIYADFLWSLSLSSTRHFAIFSAFVCIGKKSLNMNFFMLPRPKKNLFKIANVMI